MNSDDRTSTRRTSREAIWRASPLSILAIGFGAALLKFVLTSKVSPFEVAGLILTAIVQVFALRQKRVPALLVSTVVSLGIVFFLQTSVIDLKRVNTPGLEPTFPEGTVLLYLIDFYTLRPNDFILVQRDASPGTLLCIFVQQAKDEATVECLPDREQRLIKNDHIVGKVIASS